MNLKEKLVSLSPYSIGFNIYDANFVINITYPNNWTIMDLCEDGIEFVKDNSRPNLYYYIAPITVNVDRIFEAIDEIITYNVELEDKVKLFHVKVEELKQLFTEEPLEVLNTLEFKVKKKRGRKAVETVSVENDDNNEQTEKEADDVNDTVL